MQKRWQSLAMESFATETNHPVIPCVLCGKCLCVSRDMNQASPGARNAVIIGLIPNEEASRS